MTGQGKSQFVKEFIKDRACHVFDVQNEYKDLSLSPFSPRSRNISLNEKLFIKECLNKKNTVCVFEEATGFFEGRTAPEMRRVMIGKRHTGNIIILCFHSISSIPPRIMQFCNFCKLYKTNDEPYQVENKFPRLFPYYNKLLTMPNHSSLNIKLIPQ